MKAWTEVRSKMPAESRERLDAKLQDAIATMPLDKIRAEFPEGAVNIEGLAQASR